MTLNADREACQKDVMRRSNASRTALTRTALLAAGRKRFIEAGFAGAGTPDIVREAGVTRGALYHHFTDKTDLFRAVYQAEAQTVARRVEAATSHCADAREALLLGAQAYFEAMAEPGRAALMLIEAPAVLSAEEIASIDREAGGAVLLEGLAAVKPAGVAAGAQMEALAAVLSSAFDRAALETARGADAAAQRRAVQVLLERLIA